MSTKSRAPRPPIDRRILERRRQVRAEAARRRRRVTMSVLTLALLGGLAYGLSRTPLFAVQAVRIVGVDGELAAQVRTTAAVDPGVNLLAVDVGEVERRVEAIAWVKDAIVRRLPSAVEIHVARRLPAAVVRLPGAAWVVDEEGVVLGGGAPGELVLIDAPTAVLPPVGERVSDAAVRNALAVHAALPSALRTHVDRYEAPSDRGLRLHLAAAPAAEGAEPGAGVWVRFGLAERVEEKARVIGLLLDQAREQAAASGEPVADGELPPGIAELDVRAPDNPVLVPAP